MKSILVLCPSWGIETPHLGIALLVASLRRQGFQVEVCDLNIQFHNRCKEKGLWRSEEDMHWQDESSMSQFIKENDDLLNSFIDEIFSKDAQIIGFSTYCTTERLSLELARRIKEKDNSKIIVFGGLQCFFKGRAESLVNGGKVDAVVLGEADETLPELLRVIEKSGKVDFCPGVVFKRNGKTINCGPRSPIMDLDNLSFPDFSDFSLDLYDNPSQLSIISSRGCPYQCVFCNTKLFWQKYRFMSSKRIFQEMAYQLERFKGINLFTFNDHTINVNIHNLSQFCDLVIKAKLAKGQRSINWERLRWRACAIVRPEMDREILEKMKKSGCSELEYGIESGSQRILDMMRKPTSVEVVDRVIQDTHEVGIQVRANFMFGFPGETEDDFQKTLDLLKRNKDSFSQVHPSETFCHIDSDTYLYNHPEEFDIPPYLHHHFWKSLDGKNIYPERLRRHQAFCQLATSLKIPLSPGGRKVILYKEKLLEEYSCYEKTITDKTTE